MFRANNVAPVSSASSHSPSHPPGRRPAAREPRHARPAVEHVEHLEGRTLMSGSVHGVSAESVLTLPPIVAFSTKISGTVYLDANKNGVKDAGEHGLSGFTVYLDANNNGSLDAGEKRVPTDADGAYAFAARPGLYHVRLAPRFFYKQTSPSSGVYNVLLTGSNTATNRNFGVRFNPIILVPPVTVPIKIPIPDPGPLFPGPLLTGPLLRL